MASQQAVNALSTLRVSDVSYLLASLVAPAAHGYTRNVITDGDAQRLMLLSHLTSYVKTVTILWSAPRVVLVLVVVSNDSNHVIVASEGGTIYD